MPITEYQREYNRRRHEEALPAYEALMTCYPFTLEDLPGEIWKDIAGFDGYAVSNFGRVKSFKYKTIIRKPALKRQYLSVNLSIDGKKKFRAVHVLVAQAFIPNPEHKPEVNHDDGNKFNCHVSNLYWATSAENARHAYDTGLAKSGEKHYKAKIKSESDIIYIRENPDNLSTYELAEKFGMCEPIISKIQLGETYANASGTIRAKIDRRIPDEIRNQIRADWATGNFTLQQLADKYGVGKRTVWKIVHEV